MSVPVIIIIGGPRPGGRSVETENRQEFPSPEAAIAYLQSQPPADELPAGDGSTES